MRLKCISNPTKALPTALAALCTASLMSTAWADKGSSTSANSFHFTPTQSHANAGGVDGGGIIQSFEDFDLGAGCGQVGAGGVWGGFCDDGPPPVGFRIIQPAAADYTRYGSRSALHISDGSAVAGFEIASPVAASPGTGFIAADIRISDTTSLYQFVPVNNATAFFNTRINFEINGTITALTTTDCATGTFAATTGTWTAGVTMRIAVEVQAGVLRIYKDGAQIYSGIDISQQCAPGGSPIGMDQLRIFAANTTGTATLQLDNINENRSPCGTPLSFCAGDIAGPAGGPPDGNVGVPDLLGVINSWGNNGNPNGPRPLGDVFPLPGGDCVVNVSDLTQGIINKWGACPTPSGACCLPAGNCAIMTKPDCQTAGGTYQGTGILCNQVVCIPTPPNDNCQGRITVNNGVNNLVGNAGATLSPQAAPTCTTGGAANFTRDVWYTYTATCTGNLTISMCNTTGGVTDTVIAVYSGTCPSGLTQIGCDDDGCPASGSLLSELTIAAANGQTYLIRVGSWGVNPANQGPMVMNISCVNFNNDFCNEASAVAIPSSTGGTLFGATADAAPACNGVAMTKARWYSVIGNGNTLTASLCPGDPFALWDPKISVYCGPSCSNLFCVTANDDFCAPFSQVSWCAKLNQKYWIAVHSPDTVVASDTYTLVISTNATSCTPTVTCGLANDACAGAIDVTANIGGANVTGDNTIASPSGGNDPELPAGSPTCHWNGTPSAVFNTVWYKFTAPGTSLNIETCPSTTPFADSVLALYSGSCGSLVEVGCDDDGCSGAPPYYSLISATTLVPSQTYYVMLASTGAWTGSIPGPFALKLSVPAPPACPPVIPVTGCTNQIAGNGPFDGVNGTRPSAGWQNGNLGVMEDLVFCNAGGGTINQVKVHFIDQTAAGTGNLSTYNTIRVRIYNLSGGPTSGLPPCTATPLFTMDFVVGTNATKTIAGAAFGSDVELWTCTVPNWHLAQGNYGIYFSFPQLGPASPSNVTFIATGPTGNGASGNGSSPQQVYIWGNSTPTATCTAVNAAGGQHSAVCAGGTVP